MRVAWLLVPALALSITACDRKEKAPAAPAGALSITKGEAPAAPEPARPSGEKLAVMDNVPPAAAAVPPAGPPPLARPVAPPPEDRTPMESADYPRYDPRYDPTREPGDAMGYGRVTLRDCRRADRRGDPLADSDACRDRLQAFEDHRQLAEDCREAAALNDPFAHSRACRSATRR